MKSRVFKSFVKVERDAPVSLGYQCEKATRECNYSKLTSLNSGIYSIVTGKPTDQKVCSGSNDSCLA